MKRIKAGKLAPTPITRRAFVKYGVTLSSTAPFTLYASKLWAQDVRAQRRWPKYCLRRERDELFLQMTAVGYVESRHMGCRCLTPSSPQSDLLLVFDVSSQHFAETVLAVTEIPAVFDEQKLRSIQLTPSARSKLVFRVPHRRRLKLTLVDLLGWSNFQLVLPDLNRAGGQYDLEAPDSESLPSTRVEMPWGMTLSPASGGTDPSNYTFSNSAEARTAGAWAELWTTALTDNRAVDSTAPLSLEVLSVRGFVRYSVSGGVDAGNLTVTYVNREGEVFPAEPTPLNNYDRIDIAASLSRRFPYTGQVGPPPIDSAVIAYRPTVTDPSVCLNACYAPGRTISASLFRLSARGGWLQLDGNWSPYPGCALSGLVQTASLGRDHHVEAISEGFLFPFGTPCELIILSERVFAKDEDGHFVAPIIQQAFLQIPQPNSVAVGHVESPFRSIAITTQRSPPLDIPASGNPDEYRQYDFFLPMVKGTAFSFEHTGIDWAGTQHRSAMPMYFVSNKARLANGLIWEPGYSWTPTHATLNCSTPTTSHADQNHTIAQSGDGLRVVDKAWSLQPGRFAAYNGALMELAGGSVTGETSQRVDWIEWSRANVPDLAPSSVVATPFRPRARTLRIRLQGVGQISGEPSASIATYRDVRFTSAPFLDPEPTTLPADYFSNVTAQLGDPEAAYLFILDTREMVNQPGPVAQRSTDQAAQELRDAYFGLSVNPNPIPTTLFAGIDNEIRFGRTSSSESVGGLSVPDTHVSILTRKHGPVGDATFNEGRWSGYKDSVKARIQAAQRLDYIAFAHAVRPSLDLAPFDASRTQANRDALVAAARSAMQFDAPRALSSAPSGTGVSPGLNLGDLFGGNAQIIPGLTFADIFRDVALGTTANRPAGEPAASPLVWNVRLSGIEWLTQLLNGSANSISLPQVVSFLLANAKEEPDAEPLSLGMESSLQWSNSAFKDVNIGPADFIPDSDTKLTINAKARIDLGVVGIPANASDIRFSPGKPVISARAELLKFTVRIFGAIAIHFSNVAFELSEDGNKSFTLEIGSVDLLPPLDFINQIASIFGNLGGDQGIHLDLTPDRIRISQTLRFPAKEGEPLLMGPAQITNLSLGWFAAIPLRGRDVLSVGFGVSSREKPLTIYIPPWYGGKAYALLEATTRGCRLVEVSMEYGALIPVQWGIAVGQASLTAGIFFMLERDDANNSGTVTLRAFVKAAADLSVAGIIQFAGLIYIALSYITGAGRKVIQGVATVSVSIKIGFVRISYSFSAIHEEVSEDRHASFSPRMGGPMFASLAGPDRLVAVDEPHSQIGGGFAGDAIPFGPSFSGERRAAFERVLGGYKSL
jgi:hypothetical protein